MFVFFFIEVVVEEVGNVFYVIVFIDVLEVDCGDFVVGEVEVGYFGVVVYESLEVVVCEVVVDEVGSGFQLVVCECFEFVRLGCEMLVCVCLLEFFGRFVQEGGVEVG